MFSGHVNKPEGVASSLGPFQCWLLSPTAPYPQRACKLVCCALLSHCFVSMGKLLQLSVSINQGSCSVHSWGYCEWLVSGMVQSTA